MTTLLMVECSAKEEAPFLNIEKQSVTFASEQASQVISYSSSAALTASSSQPEWCGARVVAGKISSVIEITVTACNEPGSARTADITITAGSLSDVIKVKQSGPAPFFSIADEQRTQEFDVAAASATVNVITNMTFTATASAAWCMTAINATASGGNITISVADNNDIDNRTATVTVNADGFEPLTINVMQKGDVPDLAGTNVKGRVVCNGRGVAGVTVSDGFEVTTTDDNGIYRLNSGKMSNGILPPYVFISIPGNYEVTAKERAPLFYQKLTAAVDVTERHDFELTAVNNERHVVVAMADLHLANRLQDIDQFNGVQADLNATIEAYAASGVKVYGLTLGDISWETYWYSNGFTIRNYLPYMNRFKCLIFNTIGNHDNDPYMEGDRNSVFTYRDALGPSYYSFNLGKAHYVVLDDIEYINNGGSQGVYGDRKYNGKITSEQIEWLKKDLALVDDKSAPLIIGLHIPVYKTPSANFTPNPTNLSNSTEFVNCLTGFTDIHLLTGHLHYNWVLPDDARHIIEHNIAAVCATWWWTGSNGYAGNHICKDGSVGGGKVFEIDGNQVKWYYKSSGFDRNYQFRTYDLNNVHITAEKYAAKADVSKVSEYAGEYASPNNGNEILINVFGYDPLWKVEVFEGSTPLTVTRAPGKDPLHIISYECLRLNVGAEPTADFLSNNSAHLFRAKASSATSTLNIRVTDRFGNVYSETMTRPKTLNFQTK
ncbi:MAG: calcineurin-like phosphoesterase C-terminal domain-containing protein [Tannerella sp.]|nr:calcineurin-like phosphoesterase C-terminal domain-containing protein [Tannerella sp.]